MPTLDQLSWRGALVVLVQPSRAFCAQSRAIALFTLLVPPCNSELTTLPSQEHRASICRSAALYHITALHCVSGPWCPLGAHHWRPAPAAAPNVNPIICEDQRFSTGGASNAFAGVRAMQSPSRALPSGPPGTCRQQATYSQQTAAEPTLAGSQKQDEQPQSHQWGLHRARIYLVSGRDHSSGAAA